MANATTISNSEIELSKMIEREKNNEVSREELIQWFKNVCFDAAAAEKLLGDIVLCTKDHESIKAMTFGYIHRVEHHGDNISIVCVKWVTKNKFIEEAYSKREFDEHVISCGRKFED